MASDIERAAFSRGVRSRDAEIAALKGEVEKLRVALAAGPAALRALCLRDYGFQDDPYPRVIREAVVIVEAAQAAAMKDDNKKGGG